MWARGLREWSRRRDSNPEPAVYKTAALPIELRRQRTPNQGPAEAPRNDRSTHESRSSTPGPAAGRPGSALASLAGAPAPEPEIAQPASDEGQREHADAALRR